VLVVKILSVSLNLAFLRKYCDNSPVGAVYGDILYLLVSKISFKKGILGHINKAKFLLAQKYSGNVIVNMIY